MQNQEGIRKFVEAWYEYHYFGRLGKTRGIDDNSRDGKYIVSGNSDKTVRIWEIETGKLIKNLAGHHEVKTKD